MPTIAPKCYVGLFFISLLLPFRSSFAFGEGSNNDRNSGKTGDSDGNIDIKINIDIAGRSVTPPVSVPPLHHLKQFNYHHDPSLYDVYLQQDRHNPKPLGCVLSNDLVVLSFETNREGDHPWLFSEAGVREGDRIVAVDGLAVSQLSDAKGLIRTSMKLTFKEREGDLGGERDKQLHESYEESIKRHIKYEHNDGHIDLMDGHLVLSSVVVTVAEFSATTKDCFPRKIVLAEPADFCFPSSSGHRGGGFGGGSDNDESGGNGKLFQDSFVLVTRGGCSFAQKSLNVFELGGTGVIVINHEKDKRLVMPTDPQLLSKIMEIPVVMVRSLWLRSLLVVVTGCGNDEGSYRSNFLLSC